MVSIASCLQEIILDLKIKSFEGFILDLSHMRLSE